MSSKNKLQEILQKNKESLPLYTFFPNKEGKWICKLTFCFDNNEYIFQSKSSSKKESSKFAAQMAMSQLEKDMKNKKQINYKKSITILIDVENKPKI